MLKSTDRQPRESIDGQLSIAPVLSTVYRVRSRLARRDEDEVPMSEDNAADLIAASRSAQSEYLLPVEDGVFDAAAAAIGAEPSVPAEAAAGA